MKIAIIEDETVHAELLSEYIKSWSKSHKISIKIHHYLSAENFLFEWETDRDFSVLFVDIQMEKMNGMDMAKHVRGEDDKISIIFTTGISDYIGDGYEVGALHYLVKPINKTKICECMDKVLKYSADSHFILVHTTDGVNKILENDINYIEARGHGCVIETIQKQNGEIRTDLLEVRESISELEKMLRNRGFIKCHRSYLCGIRNIHHIGKTEVVFDNKNSIPVSRRLHREVNQEFIKYFTANVK